MYVGKGPEDRARSHWKEFSKSGRAVNSLQRHWFEKLISARIEPRVRIREAVILSQWQEREKFWIAYWRKLNPDLCNIASGGNAFTSEAGKLGNQVMRKLYPELVAKVTRVAGRGNRGKKRTLSQRKCMASRRKGTGLGPCPQRAQVGEENGFFGKTHSEETRAKIGEAQRSRIEGLSPEERVEQFKHNSYPGEMNPFFGRQHTEETKQKMRKPHKKFAGTLSAEALEVRRQQAARMREIRKERLRTSLIEDESPQLAKEVKIVE